MFTKKKLFFYSEDSVSFVEARRFRTKLSIGMIIGTFLFILLAGFANNYFGDVLGIGIKTATELSTENALLKDRVKELDSRLIFISGNLQKLAQSDNQLRTAVNLPKIDLETRAQGTGGVETDVYSSLVSSDANDLLTKSSMLLDKIEKEILFQKKSYVEIDHKEENNKVMFACLPAIKPMKGTYTYHGFGVRRDPILGTLRMHEGVDIHNDIGTPVYATGDGVVELCGPTGSSYGTAVEINHGFGYKTWYAHLSRSVVKSGQHVKRGTLIAYSGSTGRSTGPHLHYEVRKNGVQQNPVEYFIDDVDFEKIKAELASSSVK